MTDPAENRTLPPLRLAVAAATAGLCGVIVYNAVAGQEGRQRDVLSRLSDLEQHSTLPVTLGAGAFDGRPTTTSAVTIEELAELAASEGRGDVVADEIRRELTLLGFYEEGPDGQHRSGLGEAIEAYQHAQGLEVTGEPTSRLLEHIRFIDQIGKAAAAETGKIAVRDVDVRDVDVRDVQEGLARLGYSPGPVDGVLGSRTQDAIRKFEQDRNLPPTGTISDTLAQEVVRVLSSGG